MIEWTKLVIIVFSRSQIDGLCEIFIFSGHHLILRRQITDNFLSGHRIATFYLFASRDPGVIE